MRRCTGDAIGPAFRQNFVKVSPDASMKVECGISATCSAAGDLEGPNRPLISEVRLPQLRCMFFDRIKTGTMPAWPTGGLGA
jgi:hypothetical protein